MITSFFAWPEGTRRQKSDNFLTRLFTFFQNLNATGVMKGFEKRIASQKREEGVGRFWAIAAERRDYFTKQIAFDSLPYFIVYIPI